MWGGLLAWVRLKYTVCVRAGYIDNLGNEIQWECSGRSGASACWITNHIILYMG